MAQTRFQLRLIFTVLVAAFFTGCKTGDGDSSATDSSNAQAPLSDFEIAARLYAGTPRTPSGFLTDPAPSSFAQVTTYHIRNQHLDTGAATNYELCTDDWAEALEWSESVAASAPVYLDLVTNNQTERFHEFDRVPRDEPTHYVRMRVYRCDYLDRSGVDLAAANGFAGIFNRRPLLASALGELSEYLWFFTVYNNADHAVLASASVANANGLTHGLTLAILDRDGGSNGCDRVRIEQLTLSADESTGSLAQTVTALRQFDIRRVGEAVLDCV